MGEYALYDGEQIKIGTCEDMYYLRADQAHLVRPVPNSLDPIAEAASIRFRFPFPDEDDVAPGAFGNHERSAVLSMATPDDVSHGTIQFSARPGYLVSLPCPEGADGRALPFKMHRNGFSGSTAIVQQRCLDGVRMLVCRCEGCGEKWRVPTLDDARPYIRACLATAAEHETRAGLLGYPESQRLTDRQQGEWWAKVAERIEAGYAPGCGNLSRIKVAS